MLVLFLYFLLFAGLSTVVFALFGGYVLLVFWAVCIVLFTLRVVQLNRRKAAAAPAAPADKPPVA